MNKERKGLMSGKLEEPLIKSLNRKAVASQSPGLPRFGGYPGKGRTIDPTPTGLRQPDATQINRGEEDPTQPLRGWNPVSIYFQGSRQSAATLGSESQPLCGYET